MFHTSLSCDKKYKIYFDILNNNEWLGLLIYQHLNKPGNTSTSCPFVDTKKYGDYSMYKCVGCYPSGTTREIKEGKKYESSAYQTTLNEGFKEMLKAPMGRFMIHNSGAPDRKSIITEFGPHRDSSGISNYNINDFIINKDNIQKLNEEYNCLYQTVTYNDFKILDQSINISDVTDKFHTKKFINRIPIE